MLKKERKRAADSEKGTSNFKQSSIRSDGGDGSFGGGGSQRRRNSDHIIGHEKHAAASLENGHGEGRGRRPESDSYKAKDRQRTFDVPRTGGSSAAAIDKDDRMKTKICKDELLLLCCFLVYNLSAL